MEDMERIECLWKKFDEYKNRAEQHEFVSLFILDSKLVPLYKDLQVNYDKKHAKLFIKMMSKVLESLGVDISVV